jgi:hypothetical protein
LSIIADIFDKELNELRKVRWEKGFTADDLDEEKADTKNDLKATVVIEHLMQASDVCHTMQHWHIYRKWNKNLFHEMLLAYREGRLGSDPAEFWYEGELRFFDGYIIPLAKKLKDCRVFGVSSDECLTYAVRNRDEWREKGQSLVEEMKVEFDQVAFVESLGKDLDLLDEEEESAGGT